MFARNAIRRQTYADVMAKTQANTVGDAGSTTGSLMMLGGMIAGACAVLGLNTAYPSTRRVTDSHGYGAMDMAKNKGRWN